ncbi:putative cystathione gamma lyase [Leishmania major strain Friedlin]|uniref:plant cystathionine gamma-synthase n=1 Tax=Leishmania major TaxID=5664 RepID=E9AFE7_LEIMA|nr:putative cystathione gamma lyase [Leishmania major strain Friedlin]CAG9582678.1 cystathione_gamma_lyase_-_putative [Leishmania major strain Friedlin]CBZ12951.1 putative cystathione gamma lyase [Leishmania major strain Friedlin]|eukprot:XP_003722717.1 putative cystathione gamma lyase [Leishmania major strain Friedlin]
MSSQQHLVSDFTAGSGSWLPQSQGFDTLQVHAGVRPDPVTGAILTPIYQSTTFVQESINSYQAKGYSYTRSANPTVAVLEQKLCALENGSYCTVYNTGMAATTTAISSFMNAGDHAILTNCCYGGTNRACRVFFSRLGMEFTFVDMRDPQNVIDSIKPNTKLVISETPANPTLILIDVAAVSKICKERGIVHMCDNTFATAYIMRPLDHGADVTLISTTKYVDGHDMTVGGALVTNSKELDAKVRLTQNILGNVMSPQVAFLQLQTVKTMSLRVTKQSHNAQKIAEFLETHRAVDRVVYPGLASHPQKELADRQHRNNLHGGMLWFEVKGGTAAGRRLMDTVPRPWSLCENLGASESIITCPSVMTHANMTSEDRMKVGITDGFVRVSCGIEDVDDLIAALKVAMDALV